MSAVWGWMETDREHIKARGMAGAVKPHRKDERGGIGGIRKIVSVQAIFKRRSELRDGNTHRNISGKSTPGGRKSQCKGPDVGTRVAHLQSK